MTQPPGFASNGTTALEQELSAFEHDLMQIARRQYALEAFVEELERVTLKKPFRIWNDVAWVLLLDSRDMLIIHLASWAKELVAPSGLLSQLKSSHLSDLPSRRRETERTDRDRYLEQILDGYHRDAFSRLFPNATGPFADASDIDDLILRLKQSADALRHDRNRNRAHAFERGKPGTARMLDFAELRQAIERYERLLNDIRLVGCASTLSYHDMNDADCKETARELVDAILIGHRSRQELVMGGQDREAYYSALHGQFEARGGDGASWFNDNYD